MFPPEAMDLEGPGIPMMFIKDMYARSFEFIFVIDQSFTEKPDWFCRVTMVLYKFRGGYERLGTCPLPRIDSAAAVCSFINSNKKLASFSIKYNSDFVSGAVISVLSDDIKGVDRNDFRLVRQVHAFCKGDCYPEPRKTARSNRNVDMLNIFWFFLAPFKKLVYAWEDFGTMLQRFLEKGFGNKVFRRCDSDRAESSGCLNRKDVGFLIVMCHILLILLIFRKCIIFLSKSCFFGYISYIAQNNILLFIAINLILSVKTVFHNFILEKTRNSL